MFRLEILDAAQADLDQIFSDIAGQSGSFDIAYRFADSILSHCEDLANSKFLLGVERAELGPGIRMLPHRRYVIIFRYQGTALQIIRVLEGHRDIDTLFGRDD